MGVDDLANAITELEEDEAYEMVEEALQNKEIEPIDLLQKGVMAGLSRIGELFGEGEYYLAELVLGGDIANKCIAILQPYLPKNEGPKKGIVVIGAVKGDLHSIGYGLVATQLELAGYEVHSIGVDVPSLTFIEKAKEYNADIIGLSAFLVTTIPYCAEVIRYLKDLGIRDRFKVIIGGTETNQEAADKMGADGWSLNAAEAVKLCDRLMGHAS